MDGGSFLGDIGSALYKGVGNAVVDGLTSGAKNLVGSLGDKAKGKLFGSGVRRKKSAVTKVTEMAPLQFGGRYRGHYDHQDNGDSQWDNWGHDDHDWDQDGDGFTRYNAFLRTVPTRHTQADLKAMYRAARKNKANVAMWQAEVEKSRVKRPLTVKERANRFEAKKSILGKEGLWNRYRAHYKGTGISIEEIGGDWRSHDLPPNASPAFIQELQSYWGKHENREDRVRPSRKGVKSTPIFGDKYVRKQVGQGLYLP